MTDSRLDIAVLFFAISTFFELVCVILYAFYFPKLTIVKYYRSKAASEGSKTVSADLAAAGIPTEVHPEVCIIVSKYDQLMKFSYLKSFDLLYYLMEGPT